LNKEVAKAALVISKELIARRCLYETKTH
jgi:hypothetical protein